MKFFGKLLATAMCSIVLLSACSVGDSTWAYELNGEKMPTGVYVVGEINAYGKPWASVRNADKLKPKVSEVMQAKVGEQTGDAYISDQAQKSAMRYYGSKKMAQDLNFTLSEEYTGGALSSALSIWNGSTANYLAQYEQYGMMTTESQYIMLQTQETLEKNGISQKSLEEYYNNQILQEQLFQKIYGVGGSKEVATSELLANFDKGYAKASIITISIPYSTEEVVSEDTKAQTATKKALAETYLAEIKAGTKTFEDVKYEIDLAAATAQAVDGATAAEVTKSQPGEMDTVLKLNEESAEPNPLYDGLKSAKLDEPFITQDEYSIYIVKRLDLSKDETSLESYRSSVLMSLKLEEFNSELEAMGIAQNPVQNATAISTFAPSKLKL